VTEPWFSYSPGARVPRSSVLAAVIEAGLEAVERELQIKKRGK
jgi:hypothetical protein